MELSEKEIDKILEEYERKGGTSVDFARKTLIDLSNDVENLNELSETIEQYFDEQIGYYYAMESMRGGNEEIERLEIEKRDKQYEMDLLSDVINKVK